MNGLKKYANNKPKINDFIELIILNILWIWRRNQYRKKNANFLFPINMTNYQRYTNRDLENMIHELRRANIINNNKEEKNYKCNL